MTAELTDQAGRINNVTLVDDTVVIKLDSGLPDSWVGTAYGSMVTPAAYKAMQAWLVAVRLRGDMARVTATVCSSGLVGGAQ